MEGLRHQDPKIVLMRYLSDETSYSIAESHGVTVQALSKWLISHAEQEWKDAQVARAIARKDRAEDALAAAHDPLSLAKARELLKAAQWDLERVCKRIYGEDKQVQLTVTPILNIITTEEHRVIEFEGRTTPGDTS